MGVADCQLLEFPVIHNPQGNLAFAEQERHFPFPISRFYYLYDVPAGAARGGHAHRHCEAVLIPLSGSFEVVVDDGSERRTIRLNRPHLGLYLPTMIWRELHDFSSGAVCAVLASDLYDEDDYIRDYAEFKAATTGSQASGGS